MLGRPRGAATHWHSGRRSRSPAEGVKVRCGRVGRAASGVWAIQQLHTLRPVGLTCIVLPRPISSPSSIRPSHRSTAAATPSRWNGSSASWSVSEAVAAIGCPELGPQLHPPPHSQARAPWLAPGTNIACHVGGRRGEGRSHPAACRRPARATACEPALSAPQDRVGGTTTGATRSRQRRRRRSSR